MLAAFAVLAGACANANTTLAPDRSAVVARRVLPFPAYREEPSGEFLRTWLLCGPLPLQTDVSFDPDVFDQFELEGEHLPGFETDFLTEHGGQAQPRVQAGQVVTFRGGSATWLEHTADDFAVNLDQALSTKPLVVAYGYCEIVASEDRICLLALGTNDGGRAWFNGQPIWDFTGGRGVIPDDDVIAVRLRAGRNTLLLKVEERGGGWGFCARFLPFDAATWFARSTLFRITTQDDGTPVLEFPHDEAVASRALANVQLEIAAAGIPEQIVWRGAWTNTRAMPLPVDRAHYARYMLRVQAKASDGSTWSGAIPFAGGKRTEHVLFANGTSDYTIVVGGNASESEQWAARELAHWVKQAGQADIPIRSTSEPPRAHEIVVGFNERSRVLLGATATPPADDDQSFLWRNIGPALLIWGGKERGTMYGVLSFLERELGCRWYTPRVSVVPRRERYAFNHVRHGESPHIRVRNDYYYEAFDPTWAARNRVNGALSYRQQPGGVECYWGVHTFYQFVPPSQFFASHPEYYSLVDGKRTYHEAQLCLTNPDVVDIVTERLQQVMRDSPQYLIYSVSQNDCLHPCACDKCRALAAHEESESGPLISFVNQVAERVEKEFPNKFVGMLAYTYTRKPCKTLRPRNNVVIRLCSIDCCFSHDFLTCPENKAFLADLKGWAAVAPHLYIWDYVVNFSHYLLPYPNFRALQPNIQTLRDHKAIGIMAQGAYQSRGGEFAELRAYVIAKLLWYPDCNVDAVIDDFMYGYYGRSGQYVRAYFDILHNRVTPERHVRLQLAAEDALFADDFVRQADVLFDRAEAVADNEEVRQRVAMARLPVLYLKCKRAPHQSRQDGTFDRFWQIVDREGITHYAERGVFRRNPAGKP